MKSGVHCSGEQDPHVRSVGARPWALCRSQQRAAKMRQKPGCRAVMEMPRLLPVCTTREHQHQADPVPQHLPPQLGRPLPTPPIPPPLALPDGCFFPCAHQRCIWPSLGASLAAWSASALKPLQSPSKPITEPKAICRACPK